MKFITILLSLTAWYYAFLFVVMLLLTSVGKLTMYEDSFWITVPVLGLISQGAYVFLDRKL